MGNHEIYLKNAGTTKRILIDPLDIATEDIYLESSTWEMNSGAVDDNVVNKGETTVIALKFKNSEEHHKYISLIENYGIDDLTIFFFDGIVINLRLMGLNLTLSETGEGSQDVDKPFRYDNNGVEYETITLLFKAFGGLLDYVKGDLD